MKILKSYENFEFFFEIFEFFFEIFEILKFFEILRRFRTAEPVVEKSVNL